ncbi:hydantoinase/oxoprolinase family protein [Thermoanaerobacter thermocopriae]|uniref:hydantoinase/oxoprolinase family protein n=1 Tax=Thermoanaerobacter thermocopriae TaxID=29350 RepID=UPI000AF41A37|nr:hydantoinase/oxoprolinase family protein [Thermoanaerobacter thermocopriae]
MIVQPGPGLPYDFLACGDGNVFISGYIDHRGEIIKDFNLLEIKNAIKLFKEKNIKAYAVVTKFSIRNPSIEMKIKEILENDIPNSFITMGHTISGKLNFPRRVYTSYLNSAVHSIFDEFLSNIKKSLEKEGINASVFILKADGGTMNMSTAEKKPVETILSGPAASLMGINAMLPTDKDAILLDIGGTTTDIFFLADGVPLFEPWGIRIGKYKTLVRAIYSVSIGLGGDSSICVRNGRIKIGPQREGVPYALVVPNLRLQMP